MSKRYAPIHPGEILFEEFLKPMGITNYRLAKDIHVPAQRIGDIVNGKRAISADTALRLARYFNVSKEFWMGIQQQYDLGIAEDRLLKTIEKEVQPHDRAA